MHMPTSTWRVWDYITNLILFLFFLAIAGAIGHFGPPWFIAVCLFVCLWMMVSAIYEPSSYVDVRYSVVFIVCVLLALLLKNHSVTIVITPPLW